MTGDISDKVAHVLASKQGRKHSCHWPGCSKQVPPAFWGCPTHWSMIPAELRREVWRTYRPGQESTLTPSPAYVAVAKKIQEWIAGLTGRL